MKSKFKKLVTILMNQVDRLRPVCHQRNISRMVKWIPRKDSNHLPFLYDEARLLEFTDDSDWIFCHEGTPAVPGMEDLKLYIRICIRDSNHKTGYVIYRYRNIEREGNLNNIICAEFIRLGEKYFSIPHKSPVISPPKDSKFIGGFDGYICVLKVANRTQSKPFGGFNAASCVDTDHPAYCLTTMMMQMVYFHARREHCIPYNQEMDEFNRKGVHCPHCESDNINYIDGKDRRKSYWHCKGCGHQFRKEDLVDQT